jgi:outer membrane protein assembly factor BamB
MVVAALDLRTGEQLWKYSKARTRRNEIDEPRNDPASPTPAADSDGVYVFFHDYGLIGLSLAGKERWHLPLGPFVNNYGMGTSPVVHGNSVFLQCDQVRGSYLVAVNKRNGAIRWRKDRPSAIEGWSTPVVAPDGRHLVTLGSSGLEGLDVETGESRWHVPAAGGLMIPVPVIYRDHIIATIRGSDQPAFPSWESIRTLDTDGDGKLNPEETAKRFNKGSFGIADPSRDGFITEAEWNAFRNRGVGDFGITSVRASDRSIAWRYTRGLPYVPSPVVYGDVLYSVRNGGIVLTLDARDGKLHKEARLPGAAGEYFASPVAAGGRVYFASAEGRISIINAAPDWEVIASADLGEPVFASPAIAGDAMIVRTSSKVHCFRDSNGVSTNSRK